MNNNIEQQLKKDIDTIETAKSKYFFIGFITGCIPFIILILWLKHNNINNILIEIITLTAFITGTLNAFILKETVYNRLINFFNLKYNINYKQIKKSI